MKRLIITAFILDIVTVRGHVTFPTKSDEVTTLLPLYKTEKGVDPKSDGKIQSSFKRFNVNDTRIYLDDVVFALKNQDWTKEEEPCLNKTLIWLQNLQNFTLWAVWNWDSLSSEPQGLLYGNRYHLGNFDECMNPPWYKDYPEISSQYCLADIVMLGTDLTVKKSIPPNNYDPYQSALKMFEYKSFFLRTLNMLTWGVCVPDVCQPRSVERLTKILLAQSHLGAAGMRANISVNEECQKPYHSRPFDAQFYVFVGMAVFLITICLICTNLNHDRRDLDQNTLRHQLIGAFDLKLNAKTLLEHNEQGLLNILYGIKYITMIIIIISHQCSVFNGSAISNGLEVDKYAEGFSGVLFLHNDVAVDTFFCLSGFLLATSMSKYKKIPNLFRVIFIRYMRLIVVYATVIFYTCAIYPYTGSGPLWNRAIKADTVQCRKNWWLNLLMVSNYVDTENICLVISWYIPCDFHFFVFTLLLLWIYQKYPCPGKVLFVIITIAAIITPGVINYINDLPPVQLFTYDFITNNRVTKQFHLTYIKSHTRYAANLIGFFSGYIFTYCTSSERFKRIPQKWAITGAYFGLSTMGVMWLTGPSFLWRNYSSLESAAYAALNRPVFSFGVSMFIMCCSLGKVPMIKDFLSWYPFVPLCKLTYGMYLTHTLFIARNVYVTRNPQHTDLIIILTSSFGIVCQSLLTAFIIWLLAEAPTKNLLKICFNRPTNKNNERGEQNTGYLHNNLPTTATSEVLSSKI